MRVGALLPTMPTWTIPGVHAPEPGHAIRVQVDGKPVAVFSVGGQLLAVDAACTHVGGPLDRGSVSANVVTCPLHGSQFDLTTGQVIRGPATRGIHAYRVTANPDSLVLETD